MGAARSVGNTVWTHAAALDGHLPVLRYLHEELRGFGHRTLAQGWFLPPVFIKPNAQKSQYFMRGSMPCSVAPEVS